MTVASGVGSLPGENAAAYAEATRLVLGELADFPHLPELPARGPTANMIGRTLAMVTDLGADLQPAGWRLTDAAGVDQRRARSLLAQDLDAVEEQAQDYAGRFKIAVTGPWTLAATVERPRGDRVLADHGARRELAQALAEGVKTHVADVRRRLPDVEVVVQVDEPALPAVMAGQIPTASGFSRHRSVDAAMASPALEWVFSAVSESGATPIAHCCAAGAPISLLTGAGAEGISVDFSKLEASMYDDLAGLIDAGRPVFLGVVPSTEPAEESPRGSSSRQSGRRNDRPIPDTVLTDKVLTEKVLRLLDTLGFDPESAGEHLVITPACGLAGASPSWTRRALQLSRQVAANLTP